MDNNIKRISDSYRMMNESKPDTTSGDKGQTFKVKRELLKNLIEDGFKLDYGTKLDYTYKFPYVHAVSFKADGANGITADLDYHIGQEKLTVSFKKDNNDLSTKEEKIPWNDDLKILSKNIKTSYDEMLKDIE